MLAIAVEVVRRERVIGERERKFARGAARVPFSGGDLVKTSVTICRGGRTSAGMAFKRVVILASASDSQK